MSGEESDRSGGRSKQPSLDLRIVSADLRKFVEYVLDPDNAKGKDGIFIGMLGFRVRSHEDGRALAEGYVEQARSRLATGDYVTGRSDSHGIRFELIVDLKGMRLRTIWILRASGAFELVTPFSGFAARRRGQS